MLPFTIGHRMLSCTGVVSAGITQLGHGHSQPRCANDISLFAPLFPQNHRRVPHSHGSAAMVLQQSLAGIPALTPDHTKPLFSPEADGALHSKFLVPALSADTDPSEVAHGWTQGAESLQNFSDRLGEALPCAAFLLPQLTGTVSCGQHSGSA